MSQPGTFKPWPLATYSAKDRAGATLNGLFEGNPIVSVESLTPLEMRQRNLEEDTTKYAFLTAREQGKLLLSFIPSYGAVAGAAWELGVNLLESRSGGGPLSRWKVLELGSVILAEILGTILKVRSAAAADTIAGAAKAATGEAVEGAAKTLSDKLGAAVDSVLRTATSSTAGKQFFAGAASTSSYLDKLDNDFQDLELRIESHVSPFKRSARFQKDPRVRDQVVLMRLMRHESALRANAGGFIVATPTVEEVAEVFFVRPVDLEMNSAHPFHYAFGLNGGLLERDESGPWCSLDEWERGYFKALLDYKRKVPDARTIEDYFKWLTEPALLAETPFSAAFKEYVRANAAKLRKLPALQAQSMAANGAKGVSKGSEAYADLLMLAATTHLWAYLNTAAIKCPSCGADMQLNWGWCPYHPQVNRQNYTLRDEDGSGSWKDEFIADLKNAAEGSMWRLNETEFGRDMAVGLLRIVDYLERIPAHKPERLFVHCSEFIVIK